MSLNSATIKLIPDSNIIRIDNVDCTVENDEFIYNNCEYVIYSNILNVRSHNKNGTIKNENCEQYAIVKKNQAEFLLSTFTNIFQIIDMNIPITMSCKNAFNQLLKALTESTKHSDHLNSIIGLIKNMMDSITDEQLATFLNVKNVQPIIVDNVVNVSHQLYVMKKYIINTITGVDYFNHRNLSPMFDAFLVIISVLLNIFSNFTEFYITKDDLVVHEIGILLESIVFDRISYNLIINRKNETITRVYDMIESQYPILKTLYTEQDLQKVHPNLQKEMTQLNETYNTSIFPWILFYKMSNKTRMKMNITVLYESTKQQNKTINSQFCETILACYKELVDPLMNDNLGVYDHKTILNIFNKIKDFNIFPNSMES